MAKKKKFPFELVIVIVIAFAAAFALTTAYIQQTAPEPTIQEQFPDLLPGSYQVIDGILAYGRRPLPTFTMDPVDSIAGNVSDVRQSKIVFESRGLSVSSLISVPESCIGTTCPAFVVLPGAGITKEMEHVGLSGFLNEKGYITLTLDQKGIGETGGDPISLDEDYFFYNVGEEAIAHMIIHDALAAYDILKGIEGVGNVYIIGESAGGRVAVIAGGLEPGISGVIGISTSGYRIDQTGTEKLDEFLKSLNPDTYAGMISPRKFILIQFTQDSKTPNDLVDRLYNAARNPKEIHRIDKDYHGYDGTSVKDILENILENWK